MPKILNEKQQLIFVKAETAYKSDPTISGSNAIGAHNMKVTPAFEKSTSEDVNGIQGNQSSITVGQKVTVEFDFYLITSAVGTPPPCDPILLAGAKARVTQSDTRVTYTPVSNNFGSMAVVYQVDGYRQKVLGVRGEVSIDFSVKGLLKASFKGEGIYQDPVLATAITGVDMSGIKDPISVTNSSVSACSFFTKTIQMKSAKAELGSQFGLVELVNFEEVDYQGRDGSLSVDFRATDADLKDFTLLAKNNTKGAFNLSIGSAGNRVVFNAPSVEIADTPSLSWDNQVSYLSVSTKIVPTTNNSDWSLAFE